MGIPILDPEIGGDCLACFPPNETPRYLYASVVAMQQGALWTAVDPPPPNGIHRLDNDPGGCVWFLVEGDFMFIYTVAGGVSIFEIVYIKDIDWSFWDQRGEPCKYSFTNDGVLPGGKYYYSGVALLAFVPLGTSPSYFELAALLNIPITDRLKGDHWPSDPDGIFRFVDKVENTNILIQRDFT